MIKISALDHIVLNVAIVERALEFYVDGLGLKPERLDEYRRGEAPFPSVRINEHTIIDLFPPSMHPAGQPQDAATANLNHFCVVVDAPIDEIVAYAAQIDAAIEDGPTEVFGARGMGTSIYILDPDKNKVELRTYAR